MPRPYVIKLGRTRKGQFTGERYKKCTLAITHDSDKWIPIGDFYVRGMGSYPNRPRPDCKKCHIAQRTLDRARDRFRQGRSTSHLYVELDDTYVMLLKELKDRVGVLSALEIMQTTRTTYYAWLKRKFKKMRRHKAIRLVRFLEALRIEQQCSPSAARKAREQQRIQKWRETRALTLAAQSASVNGSDHGRREVHGSDIPQQDRDYSASSERR